ncbi:MAG TPA: hypothetical protein VN176_09600 [Verrucomicrobiae bacterium]|jgi:hypothetical protein|nr:hypothetical protein [Verrucomicrobiae bacterium]
MIKLSRPRLTVVLALCSVALLAAQSANPEFERELQAGKQAVERGNLVKCVTASAWVAEPLPVANPELIDDYSDHEQQVEPKSPEQHNFRAFELPAGEWPSPRSDKLVWLE